jgi:hypothetical protein
LTADEKVKAMSVILFCCVLSVAADRPSASVAMVLLGDGVELRRGQERARPLGTLVLLWPGDRLEAAAGGEAVLVFLGDGHRERLKPGHKATVTAKGCQPATAVQPFGAALLSPTNLAALRRLRPSASGAVSVTNKEVSGAVEVPSPSKEPRMPQGPRPRVRPTYGARIGTVRPDLSWPVAAGADGYRVEVLSPERGGTKLLWQATTKKPRLSYPAKKKPLQWGGYYNWNVRPLHGNRAGEPMVRGFFRVLTKEEIRDRAEVKRLADSKVPEDWVQAAALYGVREDFDEALRLFERLAAARPTEPAFQRALADLYEMQGRPWK